MLRVRRGDAAHDDPHLPLNFSLRLIEAGYRSCLTAILLVGCKTDCVYYPCPDLEAVSVGVSVAGSQSPPPALVVTAGDNNLPSGVCDTLGVCHVFGPPGAYHLTIAATGFTPKRVDVTVTGEAAGCNTCGHVDRQQVTIVLQPAS